MTVQLDDWSFCVDKEATSKHTTRNAGDHCICDYCKNYYETVGFTYPGLVRFLQQFGVNYLGPSELMPFEHDYLLACYRVQGSVLQWGGQPLVADGIAVMPETDREDSFLLWVGEMDLPWIQDTAPEDVVSPANLPEFLIRMQEVWQLRHNEEFIFY